MLFCAHPQAKEISDHLKKKSAGAAAEPGGTAKFVWGKKIEKDIAEGASVKDFSKKAERVRQTRREVGSMTTAIMQNLSCSLTALLACASLTAGLAKWFRAH